MRILLVEDDKLLGDGIQAGLGQAGFAVDWVQDGAQGAAALDAGSYAAVVLDLALPKLSGLELLRRLRDRGNAVPVLILTARDAINDRVKGLDGGADDYVVKPFDLDELAARLRALTRRGQGEDASILRVHELELNPAEHRAQFRGKPVELTAREFALLHELMLNAGRVLSREQLLDLMLSREAGPFDRAIDVQVSRLRQRLREDAKEPRIIKTVRGEGYVLAARVEALGTDSQSSSSGANAPSSRESIRRHQPVSGSSS